MTDTSRFQHLQRGNVPEYTFVSDSGETVRLEWFMWLGLRNFAAVLGNWQPAGTEPPENWGPAQPWSGAYDTAEGQRVSTSDARALGDALASLGRGLADVFDRLKGQMSQLPAGAEQGLPFQELLRGIPHELLEAHVATLCEEFAAFCHKGGFRIR